MDMWSLIRTLTEIPTNFEQKGPSRSSSKVQSALVKQAKRHLEKRLVKNAYCLMFLIFS